MKARTPIERERYEPGEAFDVSQGVARPEEIAALYGVERSTVMTWGRSGRAPHIITPGGHYRFSLAFHRAHLAGQRG